MAKLRGSAPILLVADLQAAVDYWRDKVGFEVGGIYNDPPDFAILHRDKIHIMLALTKPQNVRPHWHVNDKLWNIYFWVDDAKAMYEEMLQRGAKIDYTLGEKPYGCLEFGIQDIDGHDIAFGQNLD